MNDLSSAILLLILSLIAHLVEEVKTGFRKQFPLGEMPLWGFLSANGAIYLCLFALLVLSIRDHPLSIPLAWAFAIIMLLNGIAHLTIAAVRKRYFPGMITSFLLIPAALYLIVVLQVTD